MLYVCPVVVSDESHVTIFAALQMLGMGRERVTRVPTDDQGRMRADALRDVLSGLDRPALVCAQAGNVNTGAFDPLPPIVEAVRANGGWLHVDGAFGLWAAADPARRHLVEGVGTADSWTTDAHKWLNVPYDSGLAFVADPAAHHAAMTLGAAYYVETTGAERDNYNWVPESSRRARGFMIWAAPGFTPAVTTVGPHNRNMGISLASSDGLPETMTASVPARAPTGPPLIGASITVMPLAAQAVSITLRNGAPTVQVLTSVFSVLPESNPSCPVTASRNVASVGKETTMVSLASASSFGEAARRA